MHGYDGWHMTGGMWFWWILIIAAVVAVIWFVTTFARRGGGDSPERELKRRFARGEIDRQEYQQMLTELRK
jgi:putative membrane protein